MLALLTDSASYHWLPYKLVLYSSPIHTLRGYNTVELSRPLPSLTSNDVFNLCAGPLSGYPSIKQLSRYQVYKWHDLGLHFHLSEDQMGHVRNSEYPSTETFLAAKVNNKELKWKDILEALQSIGEYQLSDRVCSDQGWLLLWLNTLD